MFLGNLTFFPAMHKISGFNPTLTMWIRCGSKLPDWGSFDPRRWVKFRNVNAMWIRSRSTPHTKARPSLTHTVGYVNGTKRTVFTGNWLHDISKIKHSSLYRGSMHKWLNFVYKYDTRANKLSSFKCWAGLRFISVSVVKGALLPGRSNIQVSGLVPLTS